MSSHTLPEVMRISQARLTAGLDRFARIDLATHQQIFGPMQRMTARQLVEAVERIDLRGRGGAAFPFARKLRAVMDSAIARRRKTVILVNGAEGEPGSAKDAMLLLRSPYLVLGGALLACRALGAREIVVGGWRGTGRPVGHRGGQSRSGAECPGTGWPRCRTGSCRVRVGPSSTRSTARRLSHPGASGEPATAAWTACPPCCPTRRPTRSWPCSPCSAPTVTPRPASPPSRARCS